MHKINIYVTSTREEGLFSIVIDLVFFVLSAITSTDLAGFLKFLPRVFSELFAAAAIPPENYHHLVVVLL